jgi:hypothetical protein
MTSVEACHADLGLAAVPCPDEALTQLHKVSVATLFQVLNRLGFQRTYLTGVAPRTSVQRFLGRAFTMRCLPAREDVIRAQTQELRDTFSRTRVAAGASLREAFPLNERLRAEYESWRKQQVSWREKG